MSLLPLLSEDALLRLMKAAYRLLRYTTGELVPLTGDWYGKILINILPHLPRTVDLQNLEF